MKNRILNIAMLVAVIAMMSLFTACQDEYVAPYVDPNACNTTDVSFISFVKPVMDTQCGYCHVSGYSHGGLTTYDEVKAFAANGKLLSKIDGSMNGFLKQDSTLGCTISKIKAWVDQGMKNN